MVESYRQLQRLVSTLSDDKADLVARLKTSQQSEIDLARQVRLIYPLYRPEFF
jgi:DNA-binding transcriptional regulator YbjK